MATLTLGGKTVLTQTGSDEPVLSSNLTGSPNFDLSSSTFPAGHIIKSQSYGIDVSPSNYTNTNEVDFIYHADGSTSELQFSPIQTTTNLIVSIQMCLLHSQTWQTHLMRCYYRIGSVGSWNQFFLQGWTCYVSGTTVSNGLYMEARTSRRHGSGFSRGSDDVFIKWTHEGHASGNYFYPNAYNIDNSNVSLSSTQINQFGGLIIISEEKV